MNPIPTHPLNSVCPYFTMYPLDFPMRVLASESRKNKWVYDPFCGRGTTNLAAQLNRMPSVGTGGKITLLPGQFPAEEFATTLYDYDNPEAQAVVEPTLFSVN